MISWCSILCVVNYPFSFPHLGWADKYWSNSLEVTKKLPLTCPKGKRPHVLMLAAQGVSSSLHLLLVSHFWNVSMSFCLPPLPQDHNRILRNLLLSLPYCFSLFFLPFPSFLFRVLFRLHGAHLINPLSDSLCWSVISSTFTILTSSAVLDRLNICSRRKTRVYVSLAYAETISIR